MKRRINGSGWLEGLFLEVWDRSRGSNLIEIWRRKNWEKAQQDHGPVIAQLRQVEKSLENIRQEKFNLKYLEIPLATYIVNMLIVQGVII